MEMRIIDLVFLLQNLHQISSRSNIGACTLVLDLQPVSLVELNQVIKAWSFGSNIYLVKFVSTILCVRIPFLCSFGPYCLIL